MFIVIEEKKVKNRIKVFLLSIASLVFLSGILFNDNVFARARVDLQKSLVDKAVMQGVYKCYTGGYIRPKISPLSDYTGMNTLLTDSNSGSNYVAFPTGAGSGTMFNGFLGDSMQRYSIGNDGLSCREFFNGGNYGFLGLAGSSVGILVATGHAAPNRTNSNEVENFIRNMGYQIDIVTDSTCVSLAYSGRGGYSLVSYDTVSNSVCIDSNGELYIDKNPTQKDADGNEDAGTIIWFSKKKDNEICLTYRIGDGYTSTKDCTKFESGDTLNGQWLQKVVKNRCGGMHCVWKDAYGIEIGNIQFDVAEGAGSYTNSLSKTEANFKNGSPITAAYSAISYLFNVEIKEPSHRELNNGESQSEPIKVDKLEKRVLYQEYLTDYYKVEVNCAEGLSEEAFSGKISWVDFDATPVVARMCFYDSSKAKHENKAVNGIDDSGFYAYHSIGNLSALLSEIEKLGTDYTEDEIDKMSNIASGELENTKKLNDCKKGMANNLGWIVCPVMEWMADAAKELYEDVVEPSLVMEPEFFNENDATGQNYTYDAWKTFQGFANIIFIVIFLVVIFSQLTGVGIDNYGIKKILPKLIVTALLMNLSYTICLIAVDLSNILGNGLQNIFVTLGEGLHPVLKVGEETANIDTAALGATVFTGAGIGVAMWGFIAAVSTNPAMLLSLFLGLIGLVISLATLFILLAARKAGVVVLTVLAPLAFVCYALPNTKKYFDKWVKIYSALLLLYPICGLLVGGGSYVSKLLMASGMAESGFFNALAAMIISIVPIFFIPKVVKNSMAALGNIGEKISGIGQRLNNRAQSGIKNSEAYKNAQKMGLERRTRVKAGIDRNGNLTKAGERKARRANSRIGRILGMDKRQAALVSQAKEDLNKSQVARASLTGALARTGIASAVGLPDSGTDGELGTSFGDRTEGAYYGGDFLRAADAGNITGMNASIEAMRNSGMQAKDIAKIVRYANNHGRFDNMDGNTRAAWFRDLSKKYGNDFLATDLELGHYLRSGGSRGALGGYGEYAGNDYLKIDDIKPEDIIKLSGDSIAGLAASGKLNQSMAQRVIAMNPNISADKKIMLGAIASGAANSSTITDTAKFKKDAETLMNNYNAGATNPPETMNANGAISRETVEAWASVTPQSVNIVQPVDVDLRRIGGQELGGTGGAGAGGSTSQ